MLHHSHQNHSALTLLTHRDTFIKKNERKGKKNIKNIYFFLHAITLLLLWMFTLL